MFTAVTLIRVIVMVEETVSSSESVIDSIFRGMAVENPPMPGANLRLCVH